MSQHNVTSAIAAYQSELASLQPRIVAIESAHAVFKSEDPTDALTASIEVTRPASVVAGELTQLRTRANDLTAVIALLKSHISAKA